MVYFVRNTNHTFDINDLKKYIHKNVDYIFKKERDEILLFRGQIYLFLFFFFMMYTHSIYELSIIFNI